MSAATRGRDSGICMKLLPVSHACVGDMKVTAASWEHHGTSCTETWAGTLRDDKKQTPGTKLGMQGDPGPPGLVPRAHCRICPVGEDGVPSRRLGLEGQLQHLHKGVDAGPAQIWWGCHVIQRE